jgi:hypothetical protein
MVQVKVHIGEDVVAAAGLDLKSIAIGEHVDPAGPVAHGMPADLDQAFADDNMVGVGGITDSETENRAGCDQKERLFGTGHGCGPPVVIDAKRKAS